MNHHLIGYNELQLAQRCFVGSALEIPFGPADQPWLSEERRQAYQNVTPTRLREQEQERAIMQELIMNLKRR